MTELPTSSELDCRLAYARRGWPILPLHSPTPSGCSCRIRGCSDVGKHPRTPHGWKDATTSPPLITAWWDRWPDANVGIATGPAKLVILDVDPAKGGRATLLGLIKRCGPEV